MAARARPRWQARDPDWAQIVKLKQARLSVAISIGGEVVSADGTPLTPPLADKAVASGTAIVKIPRSVLAALGGSVSRRTC